MAYDINRQRDRQTPDESENPYDAITRAGPSVAPSSFVGGPSNATAQRVPAPEGVGQMNASGPTGTGFVNFDSLYNANAGVATREANNRNAAAQQAGAKAEAGRTGAQQAFGNAVRTGTTTAPTDSDYSWATSGLTNVEHGKRVTGAHYTSGGQSNVDGVPAPETAQAESVTNTGIAGGGKGGDNALNTGIGGKKQSQPSTPDAVQQSYVTEEQQGLDSGGAGRARDSDGNVIGTAPRDTVADAATEANARAKAGAEYAGPNALSDDAGYADLLKETIAAQQQANDPLTGLGDTDRALLGAAGRPKLAATAEKYGGLQKQLEDANTASAGQSKAAKAQTDEAADLYEQLLAKYEGRVAGEQGEEDAAQAASDSVLAGAQKNLDDRAAYTDAMSSKDPFRNTLHDVAGFFSPSDNATEANGIKSPLDAATNWFGESYLGDDASGFKPGNVSKAWGEDDADVFASMSGDDWANFNKMSERDQRAWIAARKAQLRKGSKS